MKSKFVGERSTGRAACITLLTLTVGALATSTSAAPVIAELPQVRVSYGDLELTRTAGVAKLYQRIASAAVRVCDAPNSKSSQNAARIKNCETRVIADAVARVGSPALSKYYASRTGQMVTPTVAAADR